MTGTGDRALLRRKFSHPKRLEASGKGWPLTCSMEGMLENAVYSLIEMIVVVGLIGVLSAIAVPTFLESSRRNNLWTGSERVGALVRQTRLKAISQSQTFTVRFDCPAGRPASCARSYRQCLGRQRPRPVHDDDSRRQRSGDPADRRHLGSRRCDGASSDAAWRVYGHRRFDSFNHYCELWRINTNRHCQRNRSDYLQWLLINAASRSRKSSWRCWSAWSASSGWRRS